MNGLRVNTKCEIIRLILIDYIGSSCNYLFTRDSVIFYNTENNIEHKVPKSSIERLMLDDIDSFSFNIYHTLVDGNTDLKNFLIFE